MTGAETRWQLTDQERRRAYAAAVAVASSFLGPFGPMVMWGFDYLYDRRDLIFSATGAPVQAIASDSSVLRLSTLSMPGGELTLSRSSGQPHATLSINTTLNNSARQLGIRNGDPVSVLVTGRSFVPTRNGLDVAKRSGWAVPARSGLVVPARIGEQTKVTVPKGNYSVTAFGGKRESLFTTPDPYKVVAGNTTLLDGNRQLALSLASREPLLKAFPQPSSTGTILTRPQANVISPWSAFPGRCVYCGKTADWLMAHMLFCPSKPKQAHEVLYGCDRCSARFSTPDDLRGHFAYAHPVVSWWRSLW